MRADEHAASASGVAVRRLKVLSVMASAAICALAGALYSVTVLVLTPGKSKPLSDEYLGRIGNSVQQVIALRSAHWIHLDQPDLVIDSIRRMAIAASEPAAVTV